MTDQNGAVHTYEYDELGRRTADVVTTLGPGVDGAVRRIGRSYEVRSMVEAVTSYSDVSGATPVNEVLNVYDDFGQLVAQYQEHQGEVDFENTPVVIYGYADGWDNTVRLEPMTYPDGRVLEYWYDDEAADRLSRVRTLRWDGTDVCRYSYLGLATFVTTDYPEPEVKLDYAADGHAGLDRFGRVIDLHWQRYGASSPPSSSSESDPAGDSLVHLTYGYDRASSRVHRRDLVATAHGKAFDELYGYDGMHRLATFDRGTLNTAGTAIASPAFQQGWTLDATGNWGGFTQADAADSSNDLVQARVANAVNEIIDVTRTVGADWATPEYDAVGNVTVIPQPRDMTATYRATWDAWNRLVRLEEPDGSSGWRTLQENAYDGQTWRVAVTAYDGGALYETRHSYFTGRWQAIEERLGTTPSTADAQQQYVWGQRYVDDCVLQDPDTPATGPINERLYAFADDNWDVASMATREGAIANRLNYDGYGRTGFLSSLFDADTPSTMPSRQLGFCSYALDDATFLYLARTRFYHCSFGAWISRDAYGRLLMATNLLQYGLSSPLSQVDPFGSWPGLNQVDEEIRQKFLAWAKENQDKSWTSALSGVPCPCELEKRYYTKPSCSSTPGGPPAAGTPDFVFVVPKSVESDWEQPGWRAIYWEQVAGYWGFDSVDFHPGSTYEMRSKPRDGSRQQCNYDKDGKLITSGLGAGTADRSSDTGGAHKEADVYPWQWALQLDKAAGDPPPGFWMQIHLSLRPIDNSNGCPPNP